MSLAANKNVLSLLALSASRFECRMASSSSNSSENSSRRKSASSSLSSSSSQSLIHSSATGSKISSSASAASSSSFSRLGNSISSSRPPASSTSKSVFVAKGKSKLPRKAAGGGRMVVGREEKKRVFEIPPLESLNAAPSEAPPLFPIQVRPPSWRQQQQHLQQLSQSSSATTATTTTSSSDDHIPREGSSASNWTPINQISLKPMVKFDITKIQKLNGSEKIDLFRDYIKTKAVKEAIFTYETLIYNGIGNRLGYKDHHNLFRLLLVDVVLYKPVIIKIRHQLKENGFVPTEYFSNEYIVACATWGDIEVAQRMLDECLDEKMSIFIPTWEAMFDAYLKSNHLGEVKEGEEKAAQEGKWRSGIQLWEKMSSLIPVVRPSPTIYLRAMSLYTKVGDLAALKDIYDMAEENLPRLVESWSLRSGVRGEATEIWRKDMATQLFNLYLEGLRPAKITSASSSEEKEKFEEASQRFLRIYRDFYQTGVIKGCKSNGYTLQILLKYLEQGTMTRSAIAEQAKIFWTEMVDKMEAVPRYLHYSRFIGFQDSTTDMELLYKTAVGTLVMGRFSANRQSLDSSYITSLASLDPLMAFETLKSFRAEEGVRKPLRLTYKAVHGQLIALGGMEEEAANVEKWIEEDYEMSIYN